MRIEVPISIAYGTELSLARKVILSAIEDVSEVLDNPAPALHFSAMGASSLDFTLRVWINNPEIRFPVLDKLNTNIYTALIEADIEIPYTKQDVYLHTVNET